MRVIKNYRGSRWKEKKKKDLKFKNILIILYLFFIIKLNMIF